MSEEAVWAEAVEGVTPHYGVDDVPPAWETLLYAWQHTLVDVSPFILPLVIAGAVGYGPEQAASMISACLFLMGVATFVNATWGNRLPAVLGPSATDSGAMASAGAAFGAPAMWMAGFIAGLVETVVGASGLLGRMRRLLPPYVCGLVVVTIGFSLARVAGGWLLADPRPAVLGLAASAIAIIVALTVIGHRSGYGILARGAILGGLLLAGVGGASLAGLLDTAPLARASWLALPRLLPYGGPGLGWELSLGALIGVLVGFVGSMAESIGDYAGTCAVAGVRYQVRHINRGITVEGLASAVAPLIGALPLTTYAQNTGVIATTRVASRRVIQVAACLLLLYGLSPKVGVLLVVIPRPIVGAVFLVVCGMIVVAGLRLLNTGPKGDVWMLTTAFTLVPALTLPLAAAAHADWLATQSPTVKLFLGNPVVLAVCLAVSLNALLGWALAATPERKEAACAPGPN
jgi:xanthine/uracil permease